MGVSEGGPHTGSGSGSATGAAPAGSSAGSGRDRDRQQKQARLQQATLTGLRGKIATLEGKLKAARNQTAAAQQDAAGARAAADEAARRERVLARDPPPSTATLLARVSDLEAANASLTTTLEHRMRELTYLEASLAQWQTGTPDVDELVELAVGRVTVQHEEITARVVAVFKAKDEALAAGAAEVQAVRSELDLARTTSASLAAQVEAVTAEAAESAQHVEDLCVVWWCEAVWCGVAWCGVR